MKKKISLVLFIVLAIILSSNDSYATDVIKWKDYERGGYYQYTVDNYNELFDVTEELVNEYEELLEDYEYLKDDYDDVCDDLEEKKDTIAELEDKIEEYESEIYELKDSSSKKSNDSDSNSGSKTGYIILAVCIMLVVFSPMLYGLYETIKKK